MADPEPHPWRIESSRRGYSDRFIAHRMDRCITERGLVVDPYHVLELRDWCHVVALTPAGEVVLVEEYRHAGGAVLRGLPAGTVEPGESAEAAMRRELAEETGYRSDHWTALQPVWVNPALQTNRVTGFIALDAVPDAERDLDDGETIAVLTQSVRETLDQAMAGWPICHAVQIMGLLQAREHARRHVTEEPRLAPLAD